ncbi:hypothetical protein BT69DRAFT_1349865 [Atractiella rhizophila]|nr:hypothetical protein BT69DRAFT_1349865 [Atractiella rhizophila]
MEVEAMEQNMEPVGNEIPVTTEGEVPEIETQPSSEPPVTVPLHPEDLYLCNYCGGQFHRGDYDCNRMSCIVCVRQQSQKEPAPPPESIRTVAELREQLSAMREAEDIAIYAYFNYQEFAEDIRQKRERGLQWKQRRGKAIISDEMKITDMEIQEMIWETTGYFFVYKDRPHKKKFARSVRFSCSQRNYPSDVLTGREKGKFKSGSRSTTRYPCVGSLEFNILKEGSVGYITLLHRCSHPQYTEQPVVVALGEATNIEDETSSRAPLEASAPTSASTSATPAMGALNRVSARPPRKRKKREDATGQLVPIDRPPATEDDQILMGIHNYMQQNPAPTDGHAEDINIYPFNESDDPNLPHSHENHAHPHTHDPNSNLDPNLSGDPSYYGVTANQPYATDIPVLETTVEGQSAGGKETVLMKYMQMLNEMADQEGQDGGEWDKRVEGDLERLKGTVDAWINGARDGRERKRRRIE